MNRIVIAQLRSRLQPFAQVVCSASLVAMVLLAIASSNAHSQNPLDELKQNLNKAKQQMKQAVKQGQQPASSAQPQPAQNESANAAATASDPASQSTSSGASGLAGLLNGTTNQASAASAASNLPPVPLPDIEGIRLGMPIKDANAALKAAYPGAPQSSGTSTLPMYSTPFLTGFGVGIQIGSPLSEVVIVNVTPLPDSQTVFGVWRYVNNQHLYRDNLIAALRTKYGPETARFIGPTQTDDAHASEFVWLFDQNGHPAPLPNSSDPYSTITNCALTFGQAAVNVSAFNAGGVTGANRQLIQPGGWCNTSMIALIANLNPTQILSTYTEQLIDIPSATQAARDEYSAIDNYAQQQQKKAIESAKQQQPTL
ncbi:MAG TPA: hypothetical protein VMB19_02440 [Silvibacterium sp.]|nr:hypothetical protein [Silvibacterium sp.]